jgi:hypothetical protein
VPRRFAAAFLAAAFLAAAAVLLGTVAPAEAASRFTGNDYSWPQCAVGVGNGQGAPLPVRPHRFAVVGLTNGVAMHENPCLAAMWGYARAHATWVGVYTMVTYPTRRERAAASVGHYGRCSTRACRLRNAGWAEGDFAAASLGRIGAHPPLVWIDVETGRRHPWSHSRAENALVIRAVATSLRAHGYLVGIYSIGFMWRAVAGYRTALPEWVPSGRLTGGCGHSFAGGRVWLSQWTHTYANGNQYDENAGCPSTPPAAAWWERS